MDKEVVETKTMKVNEDIKPTGDGARSLKTEPGFTPGPWHVSRGTRCYHVASADGTFETACIMFAGGKGSSAGTALSLVAVQNNEGEGEGE